VVDEDVVDAPIPTSTVGLNNALTAITSSTSLTDWVGGATLMLAPFAGAPKANVIGAIAKALVPRPAVLKAWIALTNDHKSDNGAQLLAKLGTSTLTDDVVRKSDSKDKIGYPQHDTTLPVAYYIANFEKVAAANELAEAIKATACAAPLKGSAPMVAREYFEATSDATFSGLKEELVAKIDFKRARADKIRFGTLKLKASQSIKEFVQELRLEANQAYAANEGFTQQAIEVRVYEQFLAGLTGELRNATASMSPPDISSAMTAALNAEAHGISRDDHTIHPVAGASFRPRPNTVHPPRASKGRGQTQGRNKASGGDRNKSSSMKCTYCKKSGHDIDHCWEKDPSRAPERIQIKIREARKAKNGERGAGQGDPLWNG
jgi:hypothetical protein